MTSTSSGEGFWSRLPKNPITGHLMFAASSMGGGVPLPIEARMRPPVEDGTGGELGVGHRAHPRDAAAPAMTDDADAVGAHVLHAREEIVRGLEVGNRPVVAKFVALEIHFCRLGLPVEDE